MPKINNNLKKTRTGWREIDVAALERMRQPGYHHISRGLMPDATSTDKAKYEICQNILGYKQENNLSEKEIGEKLGIKSVKRLDRKSTRLNSSHRCISYAVFCLKKKNLLPSGFEWLVMGGGLTRSLGLLFVRL